VVRIHDLVCVSIPCSVVQDWRCSKWWGFILRCVLAYRVVWCRTGGAQSGEDSYCVVC